MTAAVPGPRFRDQLRGLVHETVCNSIPDGGMTCDEIADALLPLVDRLARERAAEELEAEAAYDDQAPDEQYARGLFARRLRVRAENLRGALASPAPAPRAEEAP